MKQSIRLSLAIILLAAALGVVGWADTLPFNVPQPVIIPETGAVPITLTTPAVPSITSLNSVTITISHYWLGDLSAKLIDPSGVEIILFDRVGDPPDHSSAMLGSGLVSSSAPVDLVPAPYQFAVTGADFAAAAQAASDAETWLVPTNQTYAAQGWGTAPFPAGVWQLVITDAEDQDGGEISAAQIDYTPGSTSARTAVSLQWNAPGDIVYGTPLGSTQLNAAASINGTPVPGVFTYSPAVGTVLGAGPQTLRVTFTPQDLNTYQPATASTVLQVQRAPLTINADPKTKTYGAPVPVLTASYTGFVNGDTVASFTQPVSITTLATAASRVGTYPITLAGGASANYTFVLNSGSLTVTQAPLVITANNATMIYGSPALPSFSASYSGFVNGDTSASLVQPVTYSTPATAASPVGTYPIIISADAGPNYALTLKYGVLTITQASLTLTITADNKSKVYGAPVPQLTATYIGFINGDTPDSLAQPVTLSTPATATSPVGTYPIFVSGGASANYNLVLNGGSLTVTPAPLVITADDKSMIYGSTLPAFTASYSGFVNGDSPANLIQPVTFATTATGNSPVGTYPIVISAAASANYFLTLNNGVLTVTQATLTLNVTADNKSKVYGAPLPLLTASYNGFVNGDTPSSLTKPVVLSTPATARSPVGTYPILATGGASPNYILNLRNGTLTVTPAPLLVTAADKVKPYGAPLPAFSATYTGLVAGDTAPSLAVPLSFTTTATPASPVGTYAIAVSGGASPNYTLSYQPGTLTVSRAILTVTAVDQSKRYGEPVPALTATYDGFVNGETRDALIQPVTLQAMADSHSPVGLYQIRASGGSSPNYNLILNNGTLTITTAALMISADTLVKTYGAPLPPLTATYSGFANGDTNTSLTSPVVLACAASASSPAGTYPISITGGASPNYDITLTPGTLQVTPAPLTITAQNKTKVYGAPMPVFTATFQGFVNGDTSGRLTQPVTFTTSADVSSPAGSYPINVTGGSIPNYQMIFQPGVLTVTKATLTVAPAPQTKVYGADLPPLTATYGGFVNGDTETSVTPPIVLSTTASAQSPVGTYPISASAGANPNYNLIVNSSTLTITPAPLVITADDKSMSYGSPLPVFTASYGGFVNGDSAAVLTQPVSFTTAATSKSAVGTYPIALSGGASPNYTVTLKNGVLSITKAALALTIIPDNQVTVYGAPLPPLTATFSGAVDGDTAARLTQSVVLFTTATAGSPVGTYPIRVSGGTNDNYTFLALEGTLAITPAPLLVTADDQTKVYGSPVLPVFTAHYSGFVNGDSATSISQPPTFTTTVNVNSPVGDYPITVAGGASPNYTLSYQPGTLHVSKAVLTVTAEDKSKIYGEPLPIFTARYDGFLNGDTAASLSQPVVLSTSADSHSSAGLYQIRPSGGASTNYTLVLNNGVLTVNKAPLTITADNLSIAYGDPLPQLTATYSGFVNGDTLATLARRPKVSTTAFANSPVGRYPILVSGAEAPNYAIRYVSGTLAIMDATPAATSALADVNVGVDGSLTVRVVASSGTKVQLEWSDDLKTWNPLDLKAASSGEVLFQVGGLGGVPLRFFRAVPVTE